MTKEELDSLKDEVMRYANGCWDSILAALAPQLQPALEKGGRRHVPCPVHGGKDGFRVFQDVADTGGCVCNTCGVRSDGIATLMWVNGWRYSSTVKAVAEYLRVGNASVKPARRPPPAPKKKADTAEDDERMRQNLNRVWNATIPISDRDAEPARLYLARRGISIPPPETLRFHPSLAYHDGDKRIGEYPAIIAMVSGTQGNPVTIHRTYLTTDGKKAPVESPKKLMSYPKDRKIVGGAIRLVDPGHVLAVAEGLETALAVLEGTGLPVWCAVNALLLENFVPPSQVDRVLVFADKDRPTEQHPKGHGQEAAKHLVQRLWEKGIKASAIVPAGEIPSGQKSLDWLDILNRDGLAGFPTVQSIEAQMRRAA
jgi:putative DNA primase/helicase